MIELNKEKIKEASELIKNMIEKRDKKQREEQLTINYAKNWIKEFLND